MLGKRMNANTDPAFAGTLIRNGYGVLGKVTVTRKGTPDNILTLRDGTDANAPIIAVMNTFEGSKDYTGREFFNGLLATMSRGSAADLDISYDTALPQDTSDTNAKVYGRVGVNYKSLTKVSQDITYFNTIGLKTIRMHIPTLNPIPQTWSQPLNANFRTIAKQFHDAGRYVIWGLSWTGITSANLEAYKTAVVAEATYCQANSVCDEFVVGNEFETHLGANSGLTTADVRNWVRGTLAPAVKAVFNGKVSYAIEHSLATSDGHGSALWAAEGKGSSLDLVSLNTYGVWIQNTTEIRYSPTYVVTVPPMAAAFGSNWYISEFNVAEGTQYGQMPESRKAAEARAAISYFKKMKVPAICWFQYRGYADSDVDTQIQMMFSDDTYREIWTVIAHSDKVF